MALCALLLLCAWTGLAAAAGPRGAARPRAHRHVEEGETRTFHRADRARAGVGAGDDYGPIRVKLRLAGDRPSHRRDMVCIWPGEPDGQKEYGTNATLAMLANANRHLVFQN